MSSETWKIKTILFMRHGKTIDYLVFAVLSADRKQRIGVGIGTNTYLRKHDKWDSQEELII